jgi:hypothetical protein
MKIINLVNTWQYDLHTVSSFITYPWENKAFDCHFKSVEDASEFVTRFGYRISNKCFMPTYYDCEQEFCYGYYQHDNILYFGYIKVSITGLYVHSYRRLRVCNYCLYANCDNRIE